MDHLVAADVLAGDHAVVGDAVRLRALARGVSGSRVVNEPPDTSGPVDEPMRDAISIDERPCGDIAIVDAHERGALTHRGSRMRIVDGRVASVAPDESMDDAG